jgi:uncharacterized caspase-like protein
MLSGRPIPARHRSTALLCAAIAILTIVAAARFMRPSKAFAGINIQRDDVYILSVGIDHYPPQSGFPSIAFAEADALALGPALAKWMGPNHTGKVTVSTLLGKQATVDGVRLAMQHIASEARPSDTFIFTFDGMGVCVATHASYDFAVYDTTVSGEGTVHNGLRAKDLGALLVQIPANKQFVILDSCGSHKALDDLHAALQPPDEANNLLRRQVQLIAPDGSSFESETIKHGFLTAALLDGLAGGADVDHTGHITWERLQGYVTWKLPESVQKAGLYEPERLYALTIYDDAAVTQPPSRGIEPEVKDAPDTTGPGQDYALLIGTDEYPGGWPALHNPVFDVESLHKELVSDYGFHDDADHIVELHNVTKHQIEPAIEKLRAKHFGKNDRLLVYIAGHGLRTAIDGYIVFADSKSARTEDATDSMMSFSLLSNALNKIQVPHLLLVMDVCYGGLFDGMTDNVRTSFPALLGASTGETAPSNELIRRALEANSRIYITSGDENHQVSDGLPGQHSPFSRRFLDVLRRNRGAQPFLEISTLYNGLRTLPMEPKAGYFYAAHVEQGADFIFIPRPAVGAASSSASAGSRYRWQVGQ